MRSTVHHTDALTNSAVAVGEAGKTQIIKSIVVKCQAAARVVIFRRSGGGAEFFRLNMGIGDLIAIDLGEDGWEAAGGLEILTSVAAGDVAVTIWRRPNTGV